MIFLHNCYIGASQQKKQGRCNWFASFMAMCFYKVKNWLGVSPWNGFAILFGKEIDLGLKSIT